MLVLGDIGPDFLLLNGSQMPHVHVLVRVSDQEMYKCTKQEPARAEFSDPRPHTHFSYYADEKVLLTIAFSDANHV